MMRRFLDIEKAIEAILYVASANSDLFHVVKILYYADKYHLEKAGRLITGDSYIAMKDGPVPSGAYDIIKSVRGDGLARIDAQPEEAFAVEDWTQIKPKRRANIDYFSETDKECLDRAIAEFGKMSFAELWRRVKKEPSYQAATRNSDIPLVAIIKSLQNGAEILEYLDS